MIRFSTSGEACAEGLEVTEGVADEAPEATEGVADKVADAVAACVAVTVGAPSDPHALSTSRPLAATAILMASLMAAPHTAASLYQVRLGSTRPLVTNRK
jgi:hypothetical protein